MNADNTSNDVLNFADNKEAKLPSMLNVLTILTFIACAFELFGDIKNFFSGKENLARLQDAQSKMAEAPSWAKNFAGPDVMEMTQKAIDNRVPILIMALVSVSLSLFGAAEMRKLKKQGYQLWLVGELLPIVTSFIFIGTSFYHTIFAFGLIVPLIMIIFYTSQKKYLVN